MTISSPAVTSSQDLLSVYNWEGLTIKNVTLNQCGRYAAHLTSVSNITIEDSHIKNAALSNLMVDNDGATVSTTVRLLNTYVTLAGHMGADITCFGFESLGSVYESNGIGTGSEGVRFESGSGVFVNDWFEGNQGHHMSVGYASSQPKGGTKVTVVSPFVNSSSQAAGHAAFYINNGAFTFIGPGEWYYLEVILSSRTFPIIQR